MSDIEIPAHRAPDSDKGSPATPVAGASHVRRLLLSRGSVGAAQARLSRLVGRGLQLHLPSLAAELHVHLSLDADTAWPQPVVLAGPSGMLEIADGVRWIRALTGIDLDAADENSGEWLRAAAAGRLAGTPLAAMDRIVPAARSDGSEVVVLRLALHGTSHRLSTHARAPVATWLDILSGDAWSKLRSTSSACLDFTITNTVLLAHHRLPAFAVRRLAAGDIVLPDSPNFSCDGNGSIRLGDRQLKVRCRAPGLLEVIASENKVEAEELDETLDQAVDAQIVAAVAITHQDQKNGGSVDGNDDGRHRLAAIDQLDAVPLTLAFELGKISISLADLRTLGPQTILSVKGGSAASIAIVCSGRTLGRGEAVDVDGVLGIRITNWGETC